MFGLIHQITRSISNIGQLQTGGSSQTDLILPMLLVIVSFIVFIALIITAGKWIWNNVLITVIPGIKPIDSGFKLICLMFLCHLLFPHSTFIAK